MSEKPRELDFTITRLFRVAFEDFFKEHSLPFQTPETHIMIFAALAEIAAKIADREYTPIIKLAVKGLECLNES